ncbi:METHYLTRANSFERASE-RELATED [Salix koriyanagi]|uniref:METHYLTRANSFERASE-RELATED n=1 Tax=Salix koriyanagi TaxID=2511006 RepID=A0A9Q1A4A3_9ROSI|nr:METHYLTRANSFERASE-RELATED [Salix koriyanagi]
MSAEAEYFSKDFEWETLRQEIENNPSYQYHLLPFTDTPSQQQEIQASEDSEAWKRFHHRHSSGKFFKERSSVIPILRGNKDIIVYACDCSSETLERAKEIVHSSSIFAVQNRFHPFFCDFACTGFPKWLVCDSCIESLSLKQQECSSDVKEGGVADKSGSYLSRECGCCIGGVDFVSLIFTLSAVPLKKMSPAIMECFSVLKPGGLLLFRDYGLYDMTMLRFEQEKRVGFRIFLQGVGFIEVLVVSLLLGC